MLTSGDIRRSYIDFYTRRGHVAIPGGSLIGDSTVLFTSAGMQPLVPYFSGAPHPSGRRLVNSQRCLRTVDIDEVGDGTHLTCSRCSAAGRWATTSSASRWAGRSSGCCRSACSATRCT